MLHDPELLILDEPTDGVDPVGRANIRTILLKLKGEGKTVFINSHLLQEVQLVCDRVVMLDHGLVTNQGTISELTARRTSEAVLMVIGTDEVVRAALGGLNVCEWNRPSPEVLRVAVDVPTQLQLDQCIDRLRQAGVSIDSIERRRLTLEEVFLETIVKAEQV
jgi:ABC-2 type transport system ATP-binding protein